MSKLPHAKETSPDENFDVNYENETQSPKNAAEPTFMQEDEIEKSSEIPSAKPSSAEKDLWAFNDEWENVEMQESKQPSSQYCLENIQAIYIYAVARNDTLEGDVKLFGHAVTTKNKEIICAMHSSGDDFLIEANQIIEKKLGDTHSALQLDLKANASLTSNAIENCGTLLFMNCPPAAMLLALKDALPVNVQGSDLYYTENAKAELPIILIAHHASTRRAKWKAEIICYTAKGIIEKDGKFFAAMHSFECEATLEVHDELQKIHKGETFMVIDQSTYDSTFGVMATWGPKTQLLRAKNLAKLFRRKMSPKTHSKFCHSSHNRIPETVPNFSRAFDLFLQANEQDQKTGELYATIVKTTLSPTAKNPTVAMCGKDIGFGSVCSAICTYNRDTNELLCKSRWDAAPNHGPTTPHQTTAPAMLTLQDESKQYIIIYKPSGVGENHSSGFDTSCHKRMVLYQAARTTNPSKEAAAKTTLPIRASKHQIIVFELSKRNQNDTQFSAHFMLPTPKSADVSSTKKIMQLLNNCPFHRFLRYNAFARTKFSLHSTIEAAEKANRKEQSKKRLRRST